MHNMVDLTSHSDTSGSESKLYSDICQIINQTRSNVATYANSELIMMNWSVGKRIKDDVLFNERAAYGKQMVKRLAQKLTAEYGRGWSDRTLQHCIRSAYTFDENQIAYAVSIQLNWTHLRTLMFVSDELAQRWRRVTHRFNTLF